MGTKQTSISTLNMSAFGGKADILDAPCNVCSWPKADIRSNDGALQPVIPAKRRLETPTLGAPHRLSAALFDQLDEMRQMAALEALELVQLRAEAHL